MSASGKTPGLPDRLAARAFALAIGQESSPDRARESLLAMARGDAEALHRAHRRVEARLRERPSRLAEAAELALRTAAVIADHGDGGA